MKIADYQYELPTLRKGKAMYLEDGYNMNKHMMSDYNWRTYKDKISNIKPVGKTAVLYIGGAAEHHSLTRVYADAVPPTGVMPVQSQMGFAASRVAKYYGAEYLSINANACASSMYALFEANMLLDSGFDDVVIYGEERVDDVELLLFKKMGIDLVCSEAFVILHLQKGEQVQKVNWLYHADKNPFYVSAEGYNKSMMPYSDVDIKAVKTHGTQTPNNTEAENTAIREMFGEVPLIEYKKEIGHAQGCSTAIELCMMLDREDKGKYLVNASGLGNFYGSCIVEI
jgi:hypothetical protein